MPITHSEGCIAPPTHGHTMIHRLGNEPPPVPSEQVLARLPDTVLIVESTGKMLWANDAAHRELGLDHSEWAGRSALDLIHPDDQEMAVFALTTVLDKTVGSPLELRIAAAEGWRLVEVRGAPFDQSAAPDLPGVVAPNDQDLILVVIRDLTERRRWEVAHSRDALFRSLVQYAASLTMLVAPDLRVVTTSGAISRLLGLDPADVEARPFVELVHADDVGSVGAAFDRAGDPATDQRRISVEARLRDGLHGRFVPHQLTIVNLLDDPTVEGFIVTGHDIARQHEAEAELRDTVSLLNATLDSTADGILVVSLDGRIKSFNSQFAEMWRLAVPVLEAGDNELMLQIVKHQLIDPDAFLARVRHLQEDPGAETFDVLRCRDGRVFERTSRPLCDGHEVAGRVVSFRDVTEQAKLKAELEHQAFHDSLTGLANQALFRDRVMHAIARTERSSSELAVLFMDLDRFKKVNDSLGHPAGRPNSGRTADP